MAKKESSTKRKEFFFRKLMFKFFLDIRKKLSFYVISSHSFATTNKYSKLQNSPIIKFEIKGKKIIIKSLTKP